jgi:hypothetical protein
LGIMISHSREPTNDVANHRLHLVLPLLSFYKATSLELYLLTYINDIYDIIELYCF